LPAAAKTQLQIYNVYQHQRTPRHQFTTLQKTYHVSVRGVVKLLFRIMILFPAVIGYCNLEEENCELKRRGGEEIRKNGILRLILDRIKRDIECFEQRKKGIRGAEDEQSERILEYERLRRSKDELSGRILRYEEELKNLISKSAVEVKRNSKLNSDMNVEYEKLESTYFRLREITDPGVSST